MAYGIIIALSLHTSPLLCLSYLFTASPLCLTSAGLTLAPLPAWEEKNTPASRLSWVREQHPPLTSHTSLSSSWENPPRPERRSGGDYSHTLICLYLACSPLGREGRNLAPARCLLPLLGGRILRLLLSSLSSSGRRTEGGGQRRPEPSLLLPLRL